MAKSTKQSKGAKLPTLPPQSKVSKRPLHRPPLAPPRSSDQKVVYVGTQTPFLSAVKRCEKLLRLAEARELQSAKANTQGHRKRRAGGDEIAELTERVAKKRSGDSERVVLKGSGKAISKVLELGVWFQERDEVFAVEVKTGTAKGIDDVEVPVHRHATAGADAGEPMEQDGGGDGDPQGETEMIAETRIRNVPVVEIWVGLR